MATNKIAVLTGGGGCPGLNAVIRAVVRRSQGYGIEVLGIRNGWQGLIDDMCRVIESRRRRGRPFSIVVVAEGAAPAGEPPPENVGGGTSSGVAYRVAEQIEKRMGVETRVTVLGHVQRGGSPTAFDRILATRLGIRAVDLARDEQFGRMVALHGPRIGSVTLEEATAGPKAMDLDQFAEAEVFFG